MPSSAIPTATPSTSSRFSSRSTAGVPRPRRERITAQVSLVGVAAARRHVGERHAGSREVQRPAEAQDAGQSARSVPEQRQAAPVQLPSTHPEAVGHERDRGGRAGHRVHPPAERVDCLLGGAPRQPPGERLDRTVGDLLGEAPGGRRRQQLVQADAAVGQFVGRDAQQRRADAVMETQPHVAGAGRAVVPSGGAIGSGDEKLPTVPDQIEAAVGQDARTPLGSALPQHHARHGRRLLPVRHASIMPRRSDATA